MPNLYPKLLLPVQAAIANFMILVSNSVVVNSMHISAYCQDLLLTVTIYWLLVTFQPVPYFFKLFLKGADVMRRPQRFEKVFYFVLYKCFQVQKICFNNLCNKQTGYQLNSLHFTFKQVYILVRYCWFSAIHIQFIQYTLELSFAALKKNVICRYKIKSSEA